jgi:glycosyltransferase involved in cell wall biosynthesis
MGCKLVGRWRTVEADIWDRAYLDLCGRAMIVIGADGRGEIAFGAMQVTLDIEYGPTSIASAWIGFDEMDEVSGEGTAELLDDGSIKIESTMTTMTRPSSKRSATVFEQPANGPIIKRTLRMRHENSPAPMRENELGNTPGELVHTQDVSEVSIVASVALPPPLHGQSYVNAAVINKLQEAGQRPVVADISPGGTPGRAVYHSKRLLRVIAAANYLIAHRRCERRVFYSVLEAGHGIFYNFVLLILARAFNYEVFFHHHSAKHTLATSARFRALLWFAGPMTHVVLSDRMAQDLASRYGVDRILIAHNACVVADPGETQSDRIEGAPLTIGHLSNLSLEKGLDTVIQTVVAARKTGLNLKLVLAGPATSEASEAIVKAREVLGNMLDFRGPVSGPSKKDFFRDIDVFFFPTRYQYEAQPLVVIEALSYGVPVIASDHGYISECLGSEGYAIQPTAPISESLAVLHTFLQPELLRKRQNAARARFCELRRLSLAQYRRLVADICGRAA